MGDALCSVDLSFDDDEVENLSEQTLEDVKNKSVTSFNPLSSSPVRMNQTVTLTV
jgi:hypothetical protein